MSLKTSDPRYHLDFARWEGEDSVFEGCVVSRYTKIGGKAMVVLEDDRGLNHIYPDNPKRLTIIRKGAPRP